MREKMLQANVFICSIIIVGFLITSVISYNSNWGIFEKDVESVSALSSEGIYHTIDSIFTKPVNISLTMANDSLLKGFLFEEEGPGSDEGFIEKMKDYLGAYREKYDYDSVFLVSAQTNRYYHFNGLDRVLVQGEAENTWYYDFLESDAEYSLNIDNDEAANNEITVFINCKIKGNDGSTMGVVGVGFRVSYIQEILKEYADKFGIDAYLIDESGLIEISSQGEGYQETNFFENGQYLKLQEKILSDKRGAQYFWYSNGGNKGYLVTQYVPNLGWYLLVDSDTSALHKRLTYQFFGGVAVVFLVIALVLLTITRILRRYNKIIVDLAIAREQEHRTTFQTATEKMYENIYEFDITHDCAASEATEHYFESMGVPKNTPFNKALSIIAEKQIKEEYRQGYIDTFSGPNVLKAYERGIEKLRYDFMVSNGSGDFYWKRVTARIFYWEDDKSIRMFTYTENIDAEKQQEEQMAERMQMDSLSQLYNKAATQTHIHSLLSGGCGDYAFFILDIDNFKNVNDTWGHAMGDVAIAEFARILKGQFRDSDIVGRIGGDEFAVCVPAPSMEWVERKAAELVRALDHRVIEGVKECRLSASIGIAVSPGGGMDFETLYKNADTALYQTKKNGKNGFTVYGGKTSCRNKRLQ